MRMGCEGRFAHWHEERPPDTDSLVTKSVTKNGVGFRRVAALRAAKLQTSNSKRQMKADIRAQIFHAGIEVVRVHVKRMHVHMPKPLTIALNGNSQET